MSAPCRSVALVYPRLAAPLDGIRDHSERLRDELEGGVGIQVYLVTGEALRSPNASALTDADAVVVQYNPFAYGRWGFAPQLASRLAKLRRLRRRPRIVLNVHEAYVPMRNWRWAVMSSWQRLQLAALLGIADRTCASTEALARALSRWPPRRPVVHLPVGSNLPDMRECRDAERARLSPDGRLIVALFGKTHPSRRLTYASRALRAIAARGGEFVVLNLGAGAPTIADVPPAATVIAPGALRAADVARHLSAADLFLAPWNDGASTRRGTLMAALQHELPVVSLDGWQTGRVLRSSSGVLLTPVDRPDLFAERASILAADPAARRRLGGAGRSLYECSFDWPVIAKDLLDICAAA